MQQVSDHVDQLTQQLQEAQQAVQDAEKKAADEEQKRIKAEIDAKEAQSILNVEQAAMQAREQFQSQQGTEQPQDDPGFERWKAQLDADTRLEIARIGVEGKARDSAMKTAAAGEQSQAAEEHAEPEEPKEDNLAPLMAAIQALSDQINEHQSAPVTVVRDKNGKPTHIKRGENTRPLNRDENGRVSGI
jgi:hypothetical protein